MERERERERDNVEQNFLSKETTRTKDQGFNQQP